MRAAGGRLRLSLREREKLRAAPRKRAMQPRKRTPVFIFPAGPSPGSRERRETGRERAASRPRASDYRLTSASAGVRAG